MPDASQNPAEKPPVLKGGVFALGNFDGVHRGHQAVVKATVEKARGLGIPARVLTFEPHPRAVLKPHIPPFRLTPALVKLRLLRAFGVEDVIVVPFTTELLHMSPQEFVEQVLIGQHGVQHAIAGFDFVFGYKRAGDMQALRNMLAPHNVGVTEVTPFRDSRGEVMSSSRARKALHAGDLRTAEYILGRSWAISGIIERGAQRGRSIEVPTANITLGEYQRPKFGVYAVHAGPVGKPLNRQGIANIGTRPTVDGKTEMLEFHLFNFHDDIYGQEWEVELIDFIRPEQAFPDMDALRGQIMHDIEEAKIRLMSFSRNTGTG